MRSCQSQYQKQLLIYGASVRLPTIYHFWWYESLPTVYLQSSIPHARWFPSNLKIFTQDAGPDSKYDLHQQSGVAVITVPRLQICSQFGWKSRGLHGPSDNLQLQCGCTNFHLADSAEIWHQQNNLICLGKNVNIDVYSSENYEQPSEKYGSKYMTSTRRQQMRY